MANTRFGQTLRALRMRKGFTQQQVADELNLKNKSTLGSWEIGKSEPDGYTFLRLCKLYDVADIYLTFGYEPVDASDAIISKYNALSCDYKKIVDAQIPFMFDMQQKK